MVRTTYGLTPRNATRRALGVRTLAAFSSLAVQTRDSFAPLPCHRTHRTPLRAERPARTLAALLVARSPNPGSASLLGLAIARTRAARARDVATRARWRRCSSLASPDPGRLRSLRLAIARTRRRHAQSGRPRARWRRCSSLADPNPGSLRSSCLAIARTRRRQGWSAPGAARWRRCCVARQSKPGIASLTLPCHRTHSQPLRASSGRRRTLAALLVARSAKPGISCRSSRLAIARTRRRAGQSRHPVALVERAGQRVPRADAAPQPGRERRLVAEPVATGHQATGSSTPSTTACWSGNRPASVAPG